MTFEPIECWGFNDITWWKLPPHSIIYAINSFGAAEKKKKKSICEKERYDGDQVDHVVKQWLLKCAPVICICRVSWEEPSVLQQWLFMRMQPIELGQVLLSCILPAGAAVITSAHWYLFVESALKSWEESSVLQWLVMRMQASYSPKCLQDGGR